MQCLKNWLENNEISAVIFDFDGTLYDNSKIAIKLITSRPRDMFKMNAERQARKILKGSYFESEEKFLDEFFSIAARKRKFTKEKFSSWYTKVYLPCMVNVLHKKFSAHPRVSELFAAIKSRGIKLALLSDYSFIAERMQAISLSTENVDIMKSSQELGGLKPAPELFFKLAEQLQVAPEKILVVGDRDDTDGQGARNASMKFVQIRKAATKDEPASDSHPFLFWEDFIKAFLDN